MVCVALPLGGDGVGCFDGLLRLFTRRRAYGGELGGPKAAQRTAELTKRMEVNQKRAEHQRNQLKATINAHEWHASIQTGLQTMHGWLDLT